MVYPLKLERNKFINTSFDKTRTYAREKRYRENDIWDIEKKRKRNRARSFHAKFIRFVSSREQNDHETQRIHISHANRSIDANDHTHNEYARRHQRIAKTICFDPRSKKANSGT